MKYRPRKCRCCHEWFEPQPHNAYHQAYCTAAVCRKASKRASQRRWLRKNPGHFQGPEHVLRVQEWRAVHVGYARQLPHRQRLELKLFSWVKRPDARHLRLRVDDPKSGALQDFYFTQPPELHETAVKLVCTLQDFIGIRAAFCYC